jgi:hypothetical protein
VLEQGITTVRLTPTDDAEGNPIPQTLDLPNGTELARLEAPQQQPIHIDAVLIDQMDPPPNFYPLVLALVLDTWTHDRGWPVPQPAPVSLRTTWPAPARGAIRCWIHQLISPHDVTARWQPEGYWLLDA